MPASQVLPIPPGLSMEAAGAIPEVFLTAYLNLFMLGGLPFRDGRRATVPSTAAHPGWVPRPFSCVALLA